MRDRPDALAIAVPRNQTALMQLLQLFVGREQYLTWCGGVAERAKLASFASKMAARYPILRNSRQRSYDRTRELAVLQFVVFPVADLVHWWLLSTGGTGGLADPSTDDAKVSNNAMDAAHHLTFGDYVLLYATKLEPHTVTDRRSSRERIILKDTSTWTWKLRREVHSEVKAGIDECCARLDYGHEGSDNQKPWGLRGLLAAQRRRPLFSGVRNQVIELHRYARDQWEPRRTVWIGKHSALAARYGPTAGALRPLNEVLSSYLPKMPRLPVYDVPPLTLGEVCKGKDAPRV